MSHLDQAAALATVDKTPEQIEAERLVKAREEQLAQWSLLVKKHEAAPSTQCMARISSGAVNYSTPCLKSAKYHRLQILKTYPVDSGAPVLLYHFCASHDPITRQEKEEKKRAAEKAQYVAQRARADKEAAAKEALRKRFVALEKLAEGLTTEQLERLTVAFPTVLGSAVNDMIIAEKVAADFPEVE